MHFLYTHNELSEMKTKKNNSIDNCIKNKNKKIHRNKFNQRCKNLDLENYKSPKKEIEEDTISGTHILCSWIVILNCAYCNGSLGGAMATKWSLLLFGAQELCWWVSGPLLLAWAVPLPIAALGVAAHQDYSLAFPGRTTWLLAHWLESMEELLDEICSYSLIFLKNKWRFRTGNCHD